MKGTQQGFIALYFAFLAMLILSGIGASVFLLTLGQQRIIQNTRESLQAYYGAEAGVEDALVRLATEKTFVEGIPYNFPVGNAMAEITISAITGGARSITGEGDALSRIRNVQAVYQLSSEEVSFNFGAHIGNPALASGGLVMDHAQAKIIGNVFSNADVSGVGTITDSVVMASVGSTLSGITVNLDVEAYSCSGATIQGNLEYNSAGTNTCTVTGSTSTTSSVIAPIDFPISSSMIAEWKTEAEDGGIVDGGGNVTVSTNRTLGVGKITGNLVVNNGVTLTLTGTLWVTGTFVPNNNAIVELDDGYVDLSGMLIVDQNVDISNNVILRGSGTPGSFLAIIAMSSSLSESDPAIIIENNADSAVLFAPNGLIVIQNNSDLVEVVAHKLLIKKATITYDVGLADAKFSTGPSAGWTVTSWKEIE